MDAGLLLLPRLTKRRPLSVSWLLPVCTTCSATTSISYRTVFIVRYHVTSTRVCCLLTSFDGRIAGQFEVPLMDEFDGHRRAVAERQAAYEQSTMAKTKLIRETEARNMKVSPF